MTAADGTVDLLGALQESLTRRTDRVRWCPSVAPFTDTVRCRRLAGHSGEHASNSGDQWSPTPTTDEDQR